jgi:hypothetical protein
LSAPPGGLTRRLPYLGAQPDPFLNVLRDAHARFMALPLWFWDRTQLEPSTTRPF